MASLTQQIAAAPGQPATVRIGRIASVNPVTVSVQGVVFDDVGYVQGHTYALGDTVALVGQSNASGSDPASWLVLPTSGTSPMGYQAGQLSVSFTTLTSFTVVVNFAQPYPAGTNLSVHTNINSGVGATANWQSRAINIMPASFTLFVFTAGAASTWTNVGVVWSAFPHTS
jgi:hypothetical protein